MTRSHHTDNQFTETLGTFGHLGVMLFVFGLVVLLFLFKEGRLRPQSPGQSKTPVVSPAPPDLSGVPTADVGLRMIIDQANAEMATQSARPATPSATITNTTSESTALSTIDLTGPWYCSTVGEEGSRVTLSISRSRVRLDTTVEGVAQYVLFDGDCAYSWAGGSGNKQCGLGQYLGLLQELTGGEDIDIVSLLLSGVSGGNDTPSPAMERLIQSCKKQAVEEAVFIPPTGVNFTQTQVEVPESLDILR